MTAIYTYDLTTTTGQTRLHLADTDVDDLTDDGQNTATFTDAEIQYFLGIAGNTPMLAAAMGLEALASDAVRLALIVKTQSLGVTTSELAAQYRAQASDLRSKCPYQPVINPPDQMFTPATGNGNNPGNMTVW
ncbi:MAG TPA: hypothetical protein VN519_06770 [Bryobacteraceae bacterium]|nr:hypothetical protein [Bryobacteraceae bacterium]